MKESNTLQYADGYSEGWIRLCELPPIEVSTKIRHVRINGQFGRMSPLHWRFLFCMATHNGKLTMQNAIKCTQLTGKKKRETPIRRRTVNNLYILRKLLKELTGFRLVARFGTPSYYINRKSKELFDEKTKR